MRKRALHLLLGVLKLTGGFGGLLIAFYLASDMAAHETFSPPPVTPPSSTEMILMALLTVAVWGSLLVLAFLIASGLNSLSRYREVRWRGVLDYGRPGGH